MIDLNHIHIFKTDIQAVLPDCKVTKMFSNHPDIQRWNVDTEDIDKVLRVESGTLNPQEIIAMVRANGHFCEELP